ncbi:MAG: Rid family detoxifying hydrolase [Desulfurivibrionaceae bacterium]|nr:Rid family detoxifying hydrolase [Desulfurivibrionaceae bacterium]
MALNIIHTEHAPRPIAPYSQAVRAGNFIFVSGCLGLCPVTGVLKKENIKEEISLAIDNLENVLKAAGCRLSDIAKVNVFLSDMPLMARVNEVYKARFSAPYPARTTVAVKNLALGAHIEIEAVAMLDGE